MGKTIEVEQPAAAAGGYRARKTAAVLRLLRGEDLETVSRSCRGSASSSTSRRA